MIKPFPTTSEKTICKLNPIAKPFYWLNGFILIYITVDYLYRFNYVKPFFKFPLHVAPMVTWFTSVSCYSTWAQWQPMAQETDTLCMMRHQTSGQKSTCSMEPTSSHCSCSLTHYGSFTIRVLWDPFSSSTLFYWCMSEALKVFIYLFSICKRKIKGCGICSGPMSKHWTVWETLGCIF